MHSNIPSARSNEKYSFLLRKPRRHVVYWSPFIRAATVVVGTWTARVGCNVVRPPDALQRTRGFRSGRQLTASRGDELRKSYE
ncbi:hypothetical protein C2E23DRAFT_249544 [Lenzites betulinus]|nr:hypothetical protein C2E23DRAFT_249544 [Lenzites betulinus]